MLDLFKCATQGSIDCFCLQETWLENADLSLIQLPRYKLISLGHSASTHGGVAIYLKDIYEYNIIKHVRDRNWEGLFIEVTGRPKGQPLIIGNVYRPPNVNSISIANFTDELSNVLNIQSVSTKKCILAGDFNINLMKIHEKQSNLDT